MDRDERDFAGDDRPVTAHATAVVDDDPAPRRRVGAEGSETWTRIVDAAEAVIREEGYAAASTRRVALHAGLKPSLVHYYFPTTDDLYLACHRRGAAQSDAMIQAALDSPDPLRALWHYFCDTSRTVLSVEFIALATHREALRAEIAAHSEAMRARQARALEQVLADRLHGVGDAAGLTLVLAGVGRALMMEGAMGIAGGHDSARALIDTLLDRLLPPEILPARGRWRQRRRRGRSAWSAGLPPPPSALRTATSPWRGED